jgi:hypothetical protein
MTDRAMPMVLALALSVRLAAIIALPSWHHPDENFQLLEQAHRITFGRMGGDPRWGAPPFGHLVSGRSSLGRARC